MPREIIFASEHTKISSEKETRNKHEQGQTRAQAVELDKKRQKPNWTQKGMVREVNADGGTTGSQTDRYGS
jgi:hypothetical protein